MILHQVLQNLNEWQEPVRPFRFSSSTFNNEPVETENNFMELSESAIYDDTGVSILLKQDQT